MVRVGPKISGCLAMQSRSSRDPRKRHAPSLPLSGMSKHRSSFRRLSNMPELANISEVVHNKSKDLGLVSFTQGLQDLLLGFKESEPEQGNRSIDEGGIEKKKTKKARAAKPEQTNIEITTNISTIKEETDGEKGTLPQVIKQKFRNTAEDGKNTHTDTEKRVNLQKNAKIQAAKQINHSKVPLKSIRDIRDIDEYSSKDISESPARTQVSDED